jgi:tetratricopeptide (TPR) repeat protein
MRLEPGIAVVLALLLGTSVAGADDASVLKAREAGLTLARGQADEAVALYTEALEDKTLPNDRRAILLTDRGVARARKQNPKEAIEDFNRAIELYPEYAAVYNNRGNVLLGIGAVREAIKDFDRAIVLAPGYAAAFSNRAGAYARLGQPDPAYLDYSRAISLVPGNAAALTGRGRVNLEASRPQAAIRDLTRAVTADARFSAAYRSRAEAKMQLEKYDEAIEDFSRAIAFEARNVELYVLRGGAYLDAGNGPAAVRDFTTALELNPRNEWAYIMRGFASVKAEGFTEEALNDLARAIELDARSPQAFAYRAWIYRRQQPELALKDVERALKLGPQSAEAYWARGEIHEAQGRTDAAVQDLRKALSLKPQFKEPVRALARLGIEARAPAAEVPGAGLDGWRVSTRGRQFVATHPQYRVNVDIEMMGKGEPRILEWDVKPAPFAGIGVLRFHVGTIEGPRGKEEVEQIAIVDVQAGTVAAYETQRRGTKLARLTWDDGTLTIASADGVKEELQLRQRARETPVAAQPPKKVAEPRNPPPWSGRRGRPKTLFEMIFGN